MLILALVLIAFRGERTAESDAAINSLAVLPFANSDPATEYLSDGITESLIDSLSRMPNLKVKSSSTVFHYKGRDADPKKIATAKRYETVTFNQVLADDLKVMDASAIALCRDNNIPIVVFNIREQGNLARVLGGGGTFTVVEN